MRKSLIAGVVAVLACGMLAACAGQPAERQASDPDGAAVGQEASGGADAQEPIVESAYWKDAFPDEYNSYIDSKYAAYSKETRYGHANATWNVTRSARFSAGCLRCHTGQFTTFLDQYGDDLFTTATIAEGVLPELPFLDEANAGDGTIDRLQLRRETTNDITCYTCHGNTPGTMVVSQPWIEEAASTGGYETAMENIVCAQCHSLPDWSNIHDNADPSTWSVLQVGNAPADIWAYFQSEGYENPNVPQEIEFNHFYGSTMERAGATCSTCHALEVESEDGGSYLRHQWQSLVANDELYENCLSCHQDSTVEERKAAVEQVQADFTARYESAEELVEQLAERVLAEDAQEAFDGTSLEEATGLYYEAKFYLSYGKDNTRGFHGIGNADVEGCLDTARQLAEEGMAKLS